jgi:phytoene dehydrogenase-like protein
MLDCVIIGAGASGLSAGRSLLSRGFNILILEGNSRYGGRVNPVVVKDVNCDMGASWSYRIDSHPFIASSRTAPKLHEMADVTNTVGWLHIPHLLSILSFPSQPQQSHV